MADPKFNYAKVHDNWRDHVKSFIEEFVELRSREAVSATRYLSCLRCTSWILDGKPLPELDVQDLKKLLAYHKREGNSDSTINNYFASLSGLMEHLQWEDVIEKNIVPGFRKRFLDRNKRGRRNLVGGPKQVLDPDGMREYVHSIGDVKERLINVLLAKTGVRREELSGIDHEHIDWERLAIYIEPHPKRQNPWVFFDDETCRLLKRYSRIKEVRGEPTTGPLLLNQRGQRLGPKGIYDIVLKNGEAAGIHNRKGKSKDKHRPHEFRHFFTTWLREAGMPDWMIHTLRGDSDGSILDVYHQVQWESVREAYLAKVPQLGL